jgi:ADP-heptose:LPS heptosyltransferase
VAGESMQRKMGELPQGPIFVICPFGRHPLNSWTTAGYITLVQELSKVGSCYLIGGQGEKERLDEINTKAGNRGQVLAGFLTIAELATFLAKSSVVITVDTGPMHLAAAVGVPILALFGRSDDRVWGPRGKYDKIVRHDLPCAPCIMPRECAHHSCMQGITSKLVISTALGMLENKSGF